MTCYPLRIEELQYKKDKLLYSWEEVATYVGIESNRFTELLKLNKTDDVNEYLLICKWLSKSDNKRLQEINSKKEAREFRKKVRLLKKSEKEKNKSKLNNICYIKEFTYKNDNDDWKKELAIGDFERVYNFKITKTKQEVYYRFINPITKIRSITQTTLSPVEFEEYFKDNLIQLFIKVEEGKNERN